MMPPLPAGVGDVALFKERPNVAAGGVDVVKQGVDIGVDACAGGGDDGVVMLTKFSGSNVRADGNVAEKSQLRVPTLVTSSESRSMPEISAGSATIYKGVFTVSIIVQTELSIHTALIVLYL